MLLARVESPAYTAVTDLVPTASVETESDADPPLSVPVPSTVVPWLNVTISPLGGAPRLELTVAVKTTAWPKVDGLNDGVRVVVVPRSTT